MTKLITSDILFKLAVLVSKAKLILPAENRSE